MVRPPARRREQHGDPGNIDIAYLLRVDPPAAAKPAPAKKVITRVAVTLATLAALFGITTAQLEAANPGIGPTVRPSATVTLPSGVGSNPKGGDVIATPVPETPAKPAPAVRTLYKGTKGADVVLLQKRLGAPASGTFDSYTDRAVRDFQYVKHLTVDGRVGPATRAALGGGWQPRPVLKQGSTGRWVVIVQRRLGVAMDGRFGPKTKAAVMRYERSFGLAVNGVWSDSTWARMYRH